MNRKQSHIIFSGISLRQGGPFLREFVSLPQPFNVWTYGICICQWLVHFSEKAMAPHSSTLAWKIPWTGEPGGLQSLGSRRVGHD